MDVTLDELAGRKDIDDDAKIHNPELHRLYSKVDQLSDEDQKALVILLDSLVKRSRMSQVMGEIYQLEPITNEAGPGSNGVRVAFGFGSRTGREPAPLSRQA